MINFIGLKEQQEKLRILIDSRIANVLDHGKYILGPEIDELEKRLSEYVGSKFCITCSSGTDALLMSLMSKDIGPGDAIITTPFTYIATAEVVQLLGGKTYFCDINPLTFNLDIENLDNTYNQAANDGYQVKGIIAVDIFGLPSRYRLLEKFAKDKSIFLLQDMAQSFGSSIKNRKSGTFGDMGATSFFPSKPLGCYGDGGAIFTDNSDTAEKLRSIRVHGAGKDKYDNVRVGINGRLDTIQAAILIEKLDIFKEEFLQRQKIATYYKKHLNNEFETQYIPKEYISAHALFPIVAADQSHRERAMKALSDNNIPSMIYYKKPLHLQKTFLRESDNYLTYSNSENLSKRIFSLPFHPYLSENDLDKILNVIENVRG
jgi:UDP-2-acetamido-2-deoxy-ribo-hexuluronate aminotransferase